MAGDHDGAGFARHDRHRGDRQLGQPVERRDLSLDAPAALDVDDGKLPRVEDVAGHHDVRSPEEDEDVAVGVRGRLVQHLDRFTVQVDVLPRVVERLGRPAAGRVRRRRSRRCRHAPQDAFEGEDRGHRPHEVPLLPGNPRVRKERLARLRQHLVAADMVGIRPGVDDVANGLRRDSFDGGDDCRGVGRRPGVHDHDAVVAHLHADVGAGADDDEEVGADVQDLEAAGRRRARSLRRRAQRRYGTAIDDAERRARSDSNGDRHAGAACAKV